MADHLKKIKVTVTRNDDGLELAPPSFADRLHAPSFHIDARQMQEIKGWTPPHEYTLIVRIKQTNKTVDPVTLKHTAEFDIVAYKHIPDKTIEEMSDKEFGEYQGEELAKASRV